MVTNLDVLSSSVGSLDDAIRALYGLQENDRASTVRAAELRTALADYQYKINEAERTKTEAQAGIDSLVFKSPQLRAELEALQSEFSIRAAQGETSSLAPLGGLITQKNAEIQVANFNEIGLNTQKALYLAKINEASGMINSTTATLNAIKTELSQLEAQGYSSGGYTGSGGVSEPAGIVHKGEYVVSQSMISKLGGNQFINDMEMIRRGGYANGGLVGVSPIALAPQSAMDGSHLRSIARTMSDMQNEIRKLRDDQHNIGLRMLNNTRDTADMLESFNINGLPPTRA